MIVYAENLNKSTSTTTKPIRTINDYFKGAGYKVYTQKPMTFLRASNEQVKFAI